jgi:leucyl aminopeptidase
MEIYVRKCALEDAAVPLLVVGFFEGEEKLPDPVLALDQATRGLLTRLLSVGDFKARPRETCLVHVPAGDRAGPERILLLGLGKRAEFSLSELRRASAQAALAARDAHLCAVAYAVPLVDSLEVEEQARTVVEAAMLALYRFDRYRTREPEDRDSIDRLTLIVTGEITEEEVGPAVSEGRILAEAANLCRDLGNTPAIDATPTYMAERAMDLAADHGLVSTIIERPEMEARGMGGILGVSRGSEQPPKLVVLSHNFDRKDLPTICLVGKGITFDSGGLSLKQAPNMGDMKFDKCGACVVLATMQAVADLSLPMRVIGITPFAENMPSGAAYRPGDVLTISNGKTIEVLNTDAEGRLILADALVTATAFEPDVIIDLATLTGSCVVALGKHCAGLMSNDDGLSAALTSAGEASGERVWRLPLFPEYKEQLKSNIADMTNLGGKEGGAITAAMMLAEFVDGRTWAHLDIAGVSWRDSERDYLRKGGTGFGVRLLMSYLMNYGS